MSLPVCDTGTIVNSDLSEIIEERDECNNTLRERKCGFLDWCLLWQLKGEVAEELLLLGKIACPMILTSLLFFSKSIISMLFLGHLGNIELAGGSLAIGFANITGFSILKGLAMSMEPICCQAYGAKKWGILSETYRRSLCLLLLASFVITLLWLYIEPILIYLGQDQKITCVAKVYLTYSIPDLLTQAHLHPLRIFLRAQNLTKPLIMSAVGSMILHIPINYFLVEYLDLGVRGVALASTWNTVNLNLGMLFYLAVSNTALKPWHGVTGSRCCMGWKPLLGIVIPSVVCVCLEWWWYEIMLLLCGLFEKPQASVAAMGILIQTTGLLYTIPYSLSLGLSTRIGHELGAGQPARAERVTSIGLCVAAVCGLMSFGFTVAVRDVWGKLYTSDPQILALTSVALPILGLCELGNCPQTAAGGILTGSARPKVGATINFGSFYLVGFPVASLLGFGFKFGFNGLWYGLAAAQATCTCLMVTTLVRTDWKHQVERARELTHATEGQKNDLEADLLS